MKILDLCEFYSERGGGVRSYLCKLMEAAAPRGHEVVVVAPGPRDETTKMDGATVIRYAAPPMPYDPTYYVPWRVDRMRELVKTERPDVLQVSSPFLPAIVAQTVSAPVKSYVYHSDPIGCYLEYNARRWLPGRIAEAAVAPAWAWMRRICNSCDVTVVAGHWLERFLRNRGCQRVVTVPFGIDQQGFGPHHRSETLRRELLGSLADHPEARLLLITGRLAVDKRQIWLLRAAKLLARTRPVAVVVLGDGPERKRLEREAQDMPAVTFLSFTRDRAHYASILASVDALLHGSRGETYGFVLAETLASGTPIVVPNAGGARALAKSDCSELYEPLADEQEIAESIGRLLARPQAEVRARAAAAGKAEPSMDDHFEGLFALYGRLLAGCGAPPPAPG